MQYHIPAFVILLSCDRERSILVILHTEKERQGHSTMLSAADTAEQAEEDEGVKSWFNVFMVQDERW